MLKINKIFALLLIVIFVFPAKAHIEHYDSLSVIEFDIYRNNNRIGQHVFSFEKSGTELLVKSKINFEIKKFGVILYKYFAEGTEIFKNGILIQFNSKTDQNKKIKYVKLAIFLVLVNLIFLKAYHHIKAKKLS